MLMPTTMPTAMTRSRSDDETVLIEALAIAMHALNRVTVAQPMTPSRPGRRRRGRGPRPARDARAAATARDYLVEMRRR